MAKRLGPKALALTATAAIALTASGAVLATSRTGLPLAISSASLSQQGRELVWRVTLAAPFSPGKLARDGRTLCLLIERPGGAIVTGAACLIGPASGGRTPRLAYAPVASGSSGRARPLPATVTRTGPRELTASFLPADVGIGYHALSWRVISTLAAHACTSPRPGQARCFLLFPRKPALLHLHPPMPIGCVATGPPWVFHGPAHIREIALTFDDGPWTGTPQFLNLLEREQVVATFFQIGRQIAQYGEHGVDRRMLADGDMIGDHTWNHRSVAAGGSDAATQIKQTAAAIRRATGGFEPCLFRAPGGGVTSGLLRTARSLGFTTIQWDVDPRDWARPGVNAIYENVISHAHDGAIVIQHDGGGDRSQTLSALSREINTLRARGYQFVTLTQMLGYRLIYR